MPKEKLGILDILAKINGKENFTKRENAQCIEIARQMLKENLDVELIMKVTNLSKEEIEKIKI